MVAGRPLAVYAGPGVSLAPPQAAMARGASGAPAAVATMPRDAQGEFIGPMLTAPRPRSSQHSDRPTPEPDRQPSLGAIAARRRGAPVVRWRRVLLTDDREASALTRRPPASLSAARRTPSLSVRRFSARPAGSRNAPLRRPGGFRFDASHNQAKSSHEAMTSATPAKHHVHVPARFLVPLFAHCDSGDSHCRTLLVAHCNSPVAARLALKRALVVGCRAPHMAARGACRRARRSRTAWRPGMHGFMRPVAPDREIWDRAVNAAGGRGELQQAIQQAIASVGPRQGYSPDLRSASYWARQGADEWRLSSSRDMD